MSTQPDLNAVDRQMARDDGGAAFPSPMDGYGSGLSLRDYFAGQALNVLRDRENVTAIARGAEPNKETDALARTCYTIADAMIAERKR